MDINSFCSRLETAFSYSWAVKDLEKLQTEFLQELKQRAEGNGKRGKKTARRRRLDSTILSEISSVSQSSSGRAENSSSNISLKRTDQVLADLPINGQEVKKRLRNRKGGKGKSSDLSSNFDTSASLSSESEPVREPSTSRPKRAASRMASTYIKSQNEFMNLTRKVRRPDSSRVDKFGFAIPDVPDISAKEDALQVSKSGRSTLVKSRSKKAKLSSVLTLSSVKEKIASFEKLSQQTSVLARNDQLADNNDVASDSVGSKSMNTDVTSSTDAVSETANRESGEAVKDKTLEAVYVTTKKLRSTKKLPSTGKKRSSSKKLSRIEHKARSTKRLLSVGNKTFVQEDVPNPINTGQITAVAASTPHLRESGIIVRTTLTSISPVPPAAAVARGSVDLFSSLTADDQSPIENNTALDKTITIAAESAVDVINATRPKAMRRSKRSSDGEQSIVNDDDHMSLKSSTLVDPPARITRTRTRKRTSDNVIPTTSSGSRTKTISPPFEEAQATFIVNESQTSKRSISRSPSAPKTVVKKAKAKKAKTSNEDYFDNISDINMETNDEIVDAPPAKRVAPTRTKTLLAPSTLNLPNISLAEGRPKRIRTKVRRYGDDDSNDTEAPSGMPSSNAQEEDENLPKKTASSKIRKSMTKPKRVSMKLKKFPGSARRSSNRFKTPFTPLTSKQNIKIVSSTKKIVLSAKKVVDAEATAKNTQLRQKKENLASQKREEVLGMKTNLLRLKNFEKMERVNKTRQKMETEKQEQILLAQKEEQKRQQLIEKQKQKLLADLARKKAAEAKKMAEAEERRRLEEEARLAKAREMELEQLKQEQLKIMEREAEEKRIKERLEEEKKLKEAEKALKIKLAKRAEGMKDRTVVLSPYASKYLPRDENDYGLDEENSEDSDDDGSIPPSNKPIPKWVAAAKASREFTKYFTLEQLTAFVPAAAKTPDIRRMFNMTPSRQIRRNSSAIWNTPDFSP